MVKEHSFDIVSRLDFQEVDNAINQARREISVRYDLKNIRSKLVFDKKNKEVEISAPDEFKLKSVVDILQSKLVKRGISLKALKYRKVLPSLGGTVSLRIDLIDGVSSEKSKEIGKVIKSYNPKVKVKVEGDKIRVFSRGKDTLQQIISVIKEKDFDLPLQFVNYK